MYYLMHKKSRKVVAFDFVVDGGRHHGLVRIYYDLAPGGLLKQVYTSLKINEQTEDDAQLQKIENARQTWQQLVALGYERDTIQEDAEVIQEMF